MVGPTRSSILVIALVGCGFDSSGVGGSASDSVSSETSGEVDTFADPSTPTTTTVSTSASTTNDPTSTTDDDTTLTTSMSTTTSDDTSTSTDATDTDPPAESTGADDTTSTTSAPQPEVCDGVDNDGDGGIDEGSPANAACGGCSYLLSSTGDDWFAICTDPQLWDDARDRCGFFGGDLAKIETDADELALLGLVVEDHWIGIDDRQTDGIWLWVDGTISRNGAMVVGYDGWAVSQPDGALVENCAELDPGQQGWADSPCEQAQPYICRHPD